MNDILKLKIRQEIYQFISKYPGLHKCELSRNLKIPRSTLSYHLRYLKTQDLINVKSENRYIRFYNSNSVGNQEKKMLNLLRQKTPCKIILYFFCHVACSQIELSKELEKHPTYYRVSFEETLGYGNH